MPVYYKFLRSNVRKQMGIFGSSIDMLEVPSAGREVHKEDLHSASTVLFPFAMAAPPLVFEFIGVVFTAILYGKYCLIIFGSDDE